jgi:hypothetical protein
MAMPKGVFVANGRTASGCTAMHSTAASAAHRWRSARMPGVHRTDYGLTTGINIHVLDGDLLLIPSTSSQASIPVTAASVPLTLNFKKNLSLLL